MGVVYVFAFEKNYQGISFNYTPHNHRSVRKFQTATIKINAMQPGQTKCPLLRLGANRTRAIGCTIGSNN
jgi:hypothetical protein